MARLTARITRLERRLPTGREAELRELSDEELKRSIDGFLERMTEDDVRELVRECPTACTPEGLEDLLVRWRQVHENEQGDAV